MYSITKDHLDGLFQNYFGKKYQNQVSDRTFKPMFSDTDTLEPGDEVTYKLTGILDHNMLLHIRKFADKYHCTFWIRRDELHFAPIFSEIKKTYWTELAEKLN